MLLRHGHIASHRGDIPLTDVGLAQARAAGRWFGSERQDYVSLLTSATLRTSQTASAFAEAYQAARQADSSLAPEPAAALRNPDLYLGGQLVNLVSSAAAFVEQVPAITEDDVGRVRFFHDFLTDTDRIGYWIRHSSPPGDTALAVGRRIEIFTRSLADVPGWAGQTIIGVTHSPVLRAVALTFHGKDCGEPPYLHGYSLTLRTSGALDVEVIAPDTRHDSERPSDEEQ